MEQRSGQPEHLLVGRGEVLIDEFLRKEKAALTIGKSSAKVCL